MLGGKGEAAVGEAEEVLLLVVDEGENSPALPAALRLEIVEDLRHGSAVHLAPGNELAHEDVASDTMSVNKHM